MNLERLFRRKIFRAVKYGAHGEKTSFAMRDNRDGLVVFLEPAQKAVELGRLIIERWHIPIKRSLESIKDEIVVPIEARIVEQNARLSPSVDVMSDKAMNEDDDVFGLKNSVAQMQQVALVVWLFAKPALVD